MQAMPRSAHASSATVRVGPKALGGELVVPTDSVGLVIFAHGSGSSRFSPRNRWVAGVLQRQHLATLLFDLLDESEAADRGIVFDAPLLATRVVQALDWARQRDDLAGLHIGLFGASTGAAAALIAAAERPASVGATVSRGGRPDLATDALDHVQAPTLLIVGGDDTDVLALNRAAYRRLNCKKRLEVVPRSGHLFEEPGALDAVASLAADWFENHLGAGAPN